VKRHNNDLHVPKKSYERPTKLPKLRPVPGGETEEDMKDPGTYGAHLKNMAFRRAVVCPACYAHLHSFGSTGVSEGRHYNLHETSRRGKAAVDNQAKYAAFQRQLAS
jgi:hypothetical protein